MDGHSAAGTVRVFTDGEVVFRAGDPVDGMYVIERGVVRIRKEGDLVATVVAELGPGEILGESGLIEARPRAATAIASGDVELTFWDRAAFLDALREDPAFALRVMSALVERLRLTTERLGQLATQHVLDRAELALTERAILESELV